MIGTAESGHCVFPTTDHPECVDGFRTPGALKYIMAATQLTNHEDETKFSRIRFSCPTFITIGVRLSETTDLSERPLQIIIYRNIQFFKDLFEKFEIRSLQTTPYLIVNV